MARAERLNIALVPHLRHVTIHDAALQTALALQVAHDYLLHMQPLVVVVRLEDALARTSVQQLHLEGFDAQEVKVELHEKQQKQHSHQRWTGAQQVVR